MSRYFKEFWLNVEKTKIMPKDLAMRRFREIFSKSGSSLIEMKAVLNRINN